MRCEAERLLIAVDQHDDVRSFLADIPECGEPIAFLREAYLPHDQSSVRAVLGEMRHRTVHHSPVGSQELRNALLEAGDVEVRLLVDSKEKKAFYEWPEEVAGRVLVGDMNKPEVREAFRDAAEFAHQITRAFGKVVVIGGPRATAPSTAEAPVHRPAQRPPRHSDVDACTELGCGCLVEHACAR